MKAVVILAVLTCWTCVLAQENGTSVPQRLERGKSMQQLFAEDQADVPTNAKGPLAPLSFDEYNKRVQARMQEICARLAEGELKTGEDFYDAGFIFQHSSNDDGYLFAHVLAMEAVFRGYDRAKCAGGGKSAFADLTDGTPHLVKARKMQQKSRGMAELRRLV